MAGRGRSGRGGGGTLGFCIQSWVAGNESRDGVASAGGGASIPLSTDCT